MKVNDADMIYTGAAECDAVYKGNTLVWENNPFVQAILVVTEGTGDNGLGYGFGIDSKFRRYGSVSPDGFNNYVLSTAVHHKNSNPTSFNISMTRVGGGSMPSAASVFTRVDVQGHGWLTTADATITHNDTTVAWEWAIPTIARWDGSGTSTIIFEYLP